MWTGVFNFQFPFFLILFPFSEFFEASMRVQKRKQKLCKHLGNLAELELDVGVALGVGVVLRPG